MTLGILERASIAWPNQGMWYQPAQPFYDWSSPTRIDIEHSSDLHSHSPRRKAQPSKCLSNDPAATGGLLNPQILMGPPPPLLDGSGHRYTPNYHPPILDFSRSITAKNAADTIGGSITATQANYEHFLFDRGNVREQLHETARLDDDGGNNGTNSAEHIILPWIGSVPEDSCTDSLGHDRLAAMNKAFHKIHESPESSDYEGNAATFHESGPRLRTSSMRKGEIRSKKEGKFSRRVASQRGQRKSSKGLESGENQESESKEVAVSGHGKRKRASVIVGLVTTVPRDDRSSSPTRKLSRTVVLKSEEVSPSKYSDDFFGLREPLASLENIQ